MFSRRKPAANTLEAYASTVEQILLTLGVNVEAARLERAGGHAWGFKSGSAAIEVVVKQEDNAGYFQVLAPLVHLPQTGLLALYRRLLEKNLHMTSAALGVHGDVVYVFSERPLDGLDSGEANTLIRLVAGYADELDDSLAGEFGARIVGRV